MYLSLRCHSSPSPPPSPSPLQHLLCTPFQHGLGGRVSGEFFEHMQHLLAGVEGELVDVCGGEAFGWDWWEDWVRVSNSSAQLRRVGSKGRGDVAGTSHL
jgi:hypothetical protein